MQVKYFNGISDLQDLKKQYKVLAFKNHPDRGGNTQDMQQINAEYDFLMKKIINDSDSSNYSSSSTWESKEAHTEAEQRMKEALDKIINLDGLIIEIIGVWLWVSGDTMIHKDAIKAAGLKWNYKISKWLFVGSKSRGRGNMPIEEIRKKHGSRIVKSSKSSNLIK